jgi:hypothetical protein
MRSPRFRIGVAFELLFDVDDKRDLAKRRVELSSSEYVIEAVTVPLSSVYESAVLEGVSREYRIKCSISFIRSYNYLNTWNYIKKK